MSDEFSGYVSLTSSTEDHKIEISGSKLLAKQFVVMAGFSFWILLPFGVWGIILGEIGFGLVFLCLQVGMPALAYWILRSTPDTFAVLHQDWLKLSSFSDSRSHIKWTEVESICWPATNAQENMLRLELKPAEDGKKRFPALISLGEVARSDRALFIGYLHLAGSDIEQDNWPTFCVRYALPLLKQSGNSRDAETVDSCNDSGAESTSKSRASAIWSFFNNHPFLAGLAAPLTLIMASARIASLVSRRVWWLTATAIVLSSILNIRIIWGQWLAPFTKMCLGFAAGMFIVGALVSTKRQSSAPKDNSGFFSCIIAAVHHRFATAGKRGSLGMDSGTCCCLQFLFVDGSNFCRGNRV